MITNNNFSVLPWYTSLHEQNHYRKCTYSCIYPLVVPAKRLIPFQIHIDVNIQLSACELYIYDISNKLVSGNKLQSFINAGLFTDTVLGHTVVAYPAISDLDFTLPFGKYYLVLSHNGGSETWYSDIFTVTDISNCIKIQWWDNENLVMDRCFISYKNSFKNILYVESCISKPKYQYEEEGDDRDGIFFAEKQLSEKVYNFTFLGPEYLCDATRFIRLSDNVIIEDGNNAYDCSNIVVEVEWLDQGDLAAINVEFKLGIVTKKIAPGFNDYSSDYNSDYSD